MKSIMSTPMSGQQQYQQVQPQVQPQVQQNNYEDVVSQAIAMAQNGANMEMEFRNQLNNNPGKAQQFAQFMQQHKGRNVWDVVYDLMAQRGVNPANFGLPPRK